MFEVAANVRQNWYFLSLGGLVRASYVWVGKVTRRAVSEAFPNDRCFTRSLGEAHTANFADALLGVA